MDIPTLTAFFMWCTIINGALFLFWSVFMMAAPDMVYRTQSKFVPISREQFDLAIYTLMGLFKFGLIFFNLVPWIALSIVG